MWKTVSDKMIWVLAGSWFVICLVKEKLIGFAVLQFASVILLLSGERAQQILIALLFPDAALVGLQNIVSGQNGSQEHAIQMLLRDVQDAQDAEQEEIPMGYTPDVTEMIEEANNDEWLDAAQEALEEEKEGTYE